MSYNEIFFVKLQLFSGAFFPGSFCLQDTSIETNELVDLSSTIATKVKNKIDVLITKMPLPVAL